MSLAVSLNESRRRRRRPKRRRRSVKGTVIPYDYAAKFRFDGRPGNILQDVINIGAEGKFVATGIGYGFEEDVFEGIPLNAVVAAETAAGNDTFAPQNITLDQLPPGALLSGVRLNPGVDTDLTQGRALRESARLLQVCGRRGPISFLFSLIDSATGREMQDEPAHNLASLGDSTGERPFRELPKPMSFLPRSTIRVQVIENTEGARGTLFIVLYGYKILAESGCPETVIRNLRGAPGCPTEIIGLPSDRVVPFDYVASMTLTGNPGNDIHTEINVNAETGFVATNLGYGLRPPARSVLDDFNVGLPGGGVNLQTLQLSDFDAGALRDGIRIAPEYVRAALPDGVNLNAALPPGLVDRVFERLDCSDYLSFRYSIADSGSGRRLQNTGIYNIAGLGIANGDRPFKQFARPMVFQPRSAIQIDVREQFGRGRLYFVFQGFKMLKKLQPRIRR